MSGAGGWTWGRGVSRYVVAVLAAVLLVGFAALAGPPPAHAAPLGEPVPLGAAPRVPAGAVRVGELPARTVLHVDLVLAQRDPAGLQRFATQVSTPGSPLYRHYLDAGQVGAMFGPTAATIEAAISALHGLGLSTGRVTSNRVLLSVTATAARLESAFHTTFATYRLPGGRTAYANTSAPRLPAAVAADVTGVVGLDNLQSAHPALGRLRAAPHAAHRSGTAAPHTSTAPAAGPVPCTAVQSARTADHDLGWLTNQLAGSYQLSPLYAQGDLGAGQTVAVLELEPFTASDITTYQSCYQTSASVATVAIDGGATGVQSGEAALDIENIAGLAPQASIRVYSAPNTGSGLVDAYSRMVSDDVTQEISTSWLVCEQDDSGTQISTENTIFQQAAAQGQSVFAAAGDYGSTGCYQDSAAETELSVDDPASQPFVTGVGGTSLNTLGPPPGETAWNESTSAYSCDFVGGKCGSGGGGISTRWPMPAYQSDGRVPGVISSSSSGVPCHAASGYCREVPDVSADGDVITGYYVYNQVNGGWLLFGGTSAAAPLWAAMTALINALPQCTTRLGFANPTLYSVAARPGLGGFHDVTSGNNAYIPQAGGHYPATTGYDLATGIGTPSATSLVTQTCQPATGMHSVTPTRVLDTRAGLGGTTGPLPPGQTLVLRVDGAGGVPGNATAVVLNLTVTDPTGTGYLTAYPDGGTLPTASTLNFTPGVTRANLAVVPIGADGSIDLYNGSDGTVQLVGDVFGYDSAATPGGSFTPTAPVRVMDTRAGLGARGPVRPGGTVSLKVTHRNGVPAGATGIVLNLTVTDPQASGWVAAWPAGTREPLVSNVNFTAGQTIPNLVIVPIGAGGRVRIHNGSSGTVQLVADQLGYYTPGPLGFTATTPTRMLDTRDGTGGTTGPVAAGGTVRVKVAGVGGIPAGITAIALNVTETSPTASGFITVYPDGIPAPLASNLNFTPGLTAPNLVIVPVSAAGYIDLYNGSSGTVQLIADCAGFYG